MILLSAGVVLLLAAAAEYLAGSGLQRVPGLPPTAGVEAQAGGGSTYLPIVSKAPLPTATPTAPPEATLPPQDCPTGQTLTGNPVTTRVLENFESEAGGWQVARDTAGSGSVAQSGQVAFAGSSSARVATKSAGSLAQVRATFSDPASAHTWEERSGTWYWQRAMLYLPSATASALGSGSFLDLAGLWPSAGGNFGWWLRVRHGGALSVYGYDANGKPVEFPVYGSFPLDEWVSLTIGLHSQAGPGVGRAFAFLINGNFYGWYHQGQMKTETYDRAAAGILRTNSSAALAVYVDDWRTPSSQPIPDGPDNRPTTSLQEQDYRNPCGIQWQIDWSTWGNHLVLDPRYGLSSADSRLQSGRNLDRMPELSSGWAEIEIDWPKGPPPAPTAEYFGPMLGFHKEINREENLEVIPKVINGQIYLILEGWVNGGPTPPYAQWLLPPAAGAKGLRVPEPGDILRVRWSQSGAQLSVKADYYDASARAWLPCVLNASINDTRVCRGGTCVDFSDGYHTAASITIDTPDYSIRRFKLGTLDTYPGP